MVHKVQKWLIFNYKGFDDVASTRVAEPSTLQAATQLNSPIYRQWPKEAYTKDSKLYYNNSTHWIQLKHVIKMMQNTRRRWNRHNHNFTRRWQLGHGIRRYYGTLPITPNRNNKHNLPSGPEIIRHRRPASKMKYTYQIRLCSNQKSKINPHITDNMHMMD